MYPYLYLSPRGQAKTWELVRFAVDNAIGGWNCHIFISTDHSKEIVLEKISQLTGQNTRFLAKNNITVSSELKDVNDVPRESIRLFDEFDHFDFPNDFEIRSTDRFYGTPKEQRNLMSLKSNDILIKILEASNGHFHGRMWPIICDKGMYKEAKRILPEEQLQTEFLGNFWKLE